MDNPKRINPIQTWVLVLTMTLAMAIGVSASPIHAYADISTGLEGYWTFDSGSLSGTTLSDASGNGNNGTLVGNPATTTGIVGNGALTFNGSNQYISIPDSSSLSPSILTVSAWIKTSGNGHYQDILNKDDDNLPGRSWVFRVNTNNEVEFITFTASASIVVCTGSDDVGDGNWHLVVGRYDGTNMQIYVDGAADGNPCAQSGNIGSYDGTGGSILIATDGDDDPTFPDPGSSFAGSMDDVRIYNRALSLNDIAQLYALGGGPQPPTLPSIPTNLASSSVQTTQATISWSASTDASTTNSVAGYTVYRGGTEIATTSLTTFTDTGLSPNMTYSYTVSAYDNASPPNSSNQSSSLSVTTLGLLSSGDVYISQNGGGTQSGSDCSDALPVTWLNTSSNWGSSPNQIGPGDTVNLCGTISTTTDIIGSGTSGHPITIYFEPNAKISMPVGTLVYAANNNNYLTIDGGTNGVIENTQNGSGLAYQQEVSGIYASNCTHCEFKDLTIQNLYIHSSFTDNALPGCGSGAGIYMGGFSGDVSIDDDTFHDICWVIYAAGTTPGASGLNIYDNNFYNMDHGVAIGNPSSATNINIYNNHFGSMANWDAADVTTGYSNYHHDPIHIFAYCSLTCYGISDVNIYNNLFDGDPGVNITADVYFENRGGTMNDFHVFNNVFIIPSGDSISNNMLGIGLPDSIFANNTFIGGKAANQDDGCVGGGLIDSSTIFKNNIVTSCDRLMVAVAASTTNDLSFDYNLYANGGISAWVWCPQDPTLSTNGCTFSGGSTSAAFTTWQQELGSGISGSADTDSIMTPNALLDANGLPSSGSPAIGAGANLTSYCSTIPALCEDYAGDPRPSTGPWNIGAFQYISTSTVPTLTTSAASSLGQTSVTLNASITATGGANATQSGFAWGTNPNLVSGVSTTTEGSQTGTASFTHGLSGLTCNTTYYDRAYATNTAGTGYGSIQSFTTSACPVQNSGGGGGSSDGGGSVSSAELASLLTPSATTTAYLNSMRANNPSICPGGYVCTPAASSTATVVTPFVRNLNLGSHGGDVAALQRYLNDHGFAVAHSGPGSPSHETLYFGSLTQAALAKFQKTSGISPAIGYFGPITKAYIAAHS